MSWDNDDKENGPIQTYPSRLVDGLNIPNIQVDIPAQHPACRPNVSDIHEDRLFD